MKLNDSELYLVFGVLCFVLGYLLGIFTSIGVARRNDENNRS